MSNKDLRTIGKEYLENEPAASGRKISIAEIKTDLNLALDNLLALVRDNQANLRLPPLCFVQASWLRANCLLECYEVHLSAFGPAYYADTLRVSAVWPVAFLRNYLEEDMDGIKKIARSKKKSFPEYEWREFRAWHTQHYFASLRTVFAATTFEWNQETFAGVRTGESINIIFGEYMGPGKVVHTIDVLSAANEP
jgi:hypothetical protein